jgi:ribosomal protein S4
VAEIINLRLARKKAARLLKDQAAQQNRATFGLSKSEKRAAQTLQTDQERKLDAHLLAGPSSRDADE